MATSNVMVLTFAKDFILQYAYSNRSESIDYGCASCAARSKCSSSSLFSCTGGINVEGGWGLVGEKLSCYVERVQLIEPINLACSDRDFEDYVKCG